MIRSALVSLLVLAPQLPVRAAPPLLAPPPVVQRQGQAMLSGGALCPALQTALESAVTLFPHTLFRFDRKSVV